MQPQELVQKIVTIEEIKSYLTQVLEAFQNMDYQKLNDLLDEEAYYEDMKKTAFIYQ
jgi:predicted lipid-binding transport protein (Tim44 family)